MDKEKAFKDRLMEISYELRSMFFERDGRLTKEEIQTAKDVMRNLEGIIKCAEMFDEYDWGKNLYLRQKKGREES